MAKNLNSCKEGDIIMDLQGGKCKVLGRTGQVIFRSEYERYNIAAYHFMTVSELQEKGWKLIDPDGRESVSLKEAERLLGNVKITH